MTTADVIVLANLTIGNWLILFLQIDDPRD